MKVRHSRVNLGNKSHRHNRCSRCGGVGLIRTLKLGTTRTKARAGKKVEIRWHQAASWRVPIRASDELQAVGI